MVTAPILTKLVACSLGLLEQTLLIICVQGCTGFWPASATLEKHPVEMMSALPFYYCVQYMLENAPEKVIRLAFH